MVETARASFARTALPGLWLSMPVGIASWFAFSSGLNNILWPLTIGCVLVSLPWSIVASFLVGLVAFPLVGSSNLHGYSWVFITFYGGVVLGAHFNGYLLFGPRKAARSGAKT